MIYILFQLSILVIAARAGHYKGGLINWKPVDPYTNSSTVEVIIYQSHSWTLTRLHCDQALIDSLGLYVDGTSFTGQPFIACESPAGCSGTGFNTIRQVTFCTDFSTAVQISSGALIKKITLDRNTDILVGFTGNSWASEIKTSLNAVADYWRVITHIDLTQKYPINSSPVTGSLPLIRVIEGQTAIIQIPAADWDRTDDIRCRWADSSGPAGDECGDICNNLPGANLSSSECTITWNAVRRSVDAHLTTSTYVVAIMVEDFVNSASTTPMSSVPLQMLIYTYQPASGACSVIPAIIGDRPNRACIGVLPGVQHVERIVAAVYCTGDYITEFITISPLYMKKTAIARVSGTTNQWYITLTWTPTTDQRGPQVFCAAPIDQKELTGSQHCVNFVVGYLPPNLITPRLVQGSASPLGTVFANHSLFSIQATGDVYRPSRNGTYIQIFNKANPSCAEWEVDCGYSSDCIYSGQTVLFYVRNANWAYGANYYILFSSGAASGNIFCNPESDPITDTSFWNFNIWDPGVSSTTTTTTTPPTTGTVTTRPLGTTTPNASLTTTGIIATSASTIQTTTVTTTTTTTTSPTTSVTTTTSTTTETEMNVMSAKDFEEYCRQPVAIANAVSMIVMVPINIIGMFTAFTKFDKMFNRNRLAANARHKMFVSRVS
ncbi:unnamed protein product [Rotaria sp. Silwood1]|nr:unnamed protein product [Rotaria sp. Silwood1]